jgi:hypothetical protein
MDQSHEKVTNDFGFHPATDITSEIHNATRANFANLAHWVIDNVPPSEARKQSIHRLREAMMWANGAIAADSNSGALVDLEGPQ